jgi:hypothetical protein
VKSAVELLVLHAVRLKGMADDEGVAGRFDVDRAQARELLLDSQAFGWISWSEFAGIGGWSLTAAGRAENGRQLAAELDATPTTPAEAMGGREDAMGGREDAMGGREDEVGGHGRVAGRRDVVRVAYEVFLPLNARLQLACTDWQLRPTTADAFAFNDHTDPAWDQRVIDELEALDRELKSVVDQLTGALDRFRHYDTRFGGAVRRAADGEGAWVDGTSVDSCHVVWFELHEDLLATLGLQRGD